MPWADFREFMAELERRGEVLPVPGADCHLEIGALTELMCERKGPMLLFERINGYPAEYRIASKPYATAFRSAIALGLPEDVSDFEMFRALRDRMRDYRAIAPREVSSGPVMENVREGDDVDLTQFPVPVWHERDGGPYFGTGCALITRDPEEGWVNAGAYRSQLHDARTAGLDIAPYHHGNIHMRKWWAQGKSSPVAMAITPDPYLFRTATESVPWGSSEFEAAGFLKGEPVDVIRGPLTGLPLPANAELVVEGEVPPPSVEERMEGPFGEFTGYYAGGEKARPVFRVQALYYRTNPILHGDPPLRPPVGHWGFASSTLLGVWEGLEKAGLPGVVGVYALPVGGSQGVVVSVRQQYAGHARQVGRVASALNHTFCKLVVVVDEDIDPSRPEEVLWAICTRTDPATTFEIETDCASSTLDPMIHPDEKTKQTIGGLTSSRALVIACRPWEWRDRFPPVNRNSEQLRRQTYDKWRGLIDAAPRSGSGASREKEHAGAI